MNQRLDAGLRGKAATTRPAAWRRRSGRRISRAHRVAARIGVGICWLNSRFLRDLRMPSGGSKHPGIGREGGVHLPEFYTELRNVCVKL